MRLLKPAFQVRVQDTNMQGIKGAEVLLKSARHEFSLNCDNSGGYYSTEEKIHRGEYELTVRKKPFEEERRKIRVRGDEQKEIFYLRKKDTPYFYRGKVKVPFTPLEDTRAIVIKAGIKANDKVDAEKEIVEKLAKKYKLKIEEYGEVLAGQGVYICKFAGQLTEKKKHEICQKIDKEKEVMAAPVLKLMRNNAILLTNEINVAFEDYVEEAEVQQLASQYNLKVQRKMPALGNVYLLTTNETASYETLSIFHEIAEREEVVFAEPNSISVNEPASVTPTDFLFREQWDYRIINTSEAWQYLRDINPEITFGRPDVTIAIIDQGVDINHPDFDETLSDGSSKFYQVFDFRNMVPHNDLFTGYHGTAFASAAAAFTNNPSSVAGVGEGMAGVAGNCRLMAIRSGRTESRIAEMYLWVAGLDPESEDERFPEPISPGADVIALGYSPPPGYYVPGVIQAAFDRITDEAKDGRGIPIFIPSGNDYYGNIGEYAQYERTIAIAGSTLAGDGVSEIRTPNSAFGEEVDVCTPTDDRGSFYPEGTSQGLHNPPERYGIIAAHSGSHIAGVDRTVGRPSIRMALAEIAYEGDEVVRVNSVAGLSTDQAIMFEDPGSANSEAHSIMAINPATNQITLSRALFHTHFFGSRVYA
jgi:hypothetical protein